MPSITIHERVGEYIAKKENISSYDYYLGLLAPDAPNLEEFAPREERWMAHQRRKDYDEWKKSIKNFYHQEKNYYPKDFMIGYYIHVITDIIFDDLFYESVREKILEEYPFEKAHDIMRKDMNLYYFKEIESIKDLLIKEDKSYDILNISKERLLKWKNKKIEEWNPPNKSVYISEELLKELEEKVYEEFKKITEK